MTDFQATLKEKVAAFEEVLKKYLPKEEGAQKTVLEAMNYSLLAGGKRIRPIMMAEMYYLMGGRDAVIEPFMAAIEMIHTYSLVHDDLPAMDNDQYRRGRETTWKVYGDACGILAGDGLLNYAFETAFTAFPSDEKLPDMDDVSGLMVHARRLHALNRALQVLASKAGVYGMIGGQVADIEAEEEEKVSMDQLLFIHEHKTAALIQASLMVGAILAGASENELKIVEQCGYNVGVAFQIQDDILDVIGDSAQMGKMVGSDMQNHKQTYVTLRGLEESGRDVEKMSGEAVVQLRKLVGENTFLEQLFLELIHRNH